MDKSILQEIYSDIGNPAGLSSVKKLFNAGKKLIPTLKIEEVKDFLKSQESYTLMLRKPKRFPRRFFQSPKPYIYATGDVMYFKDYSKSNDGINFLLILQDIYSRYMTIFSLKNIRGKNVAGCLNSFFSNSIGEYKFFLTDRGTEFVNSDCQKVYVKHKVKNYHISSYEIKASIIENSILNIRRRIAKYMIHNNTERYLEGLSEIVYSFNIGQHSGLLNESPFDISLLTEPSKIINFTKRIYSKKLNKINKFNTSLAVGAIVRVRSTASTQNKFTKAHYVINSYELFKIHKINKTLPVTYSLKDLCGEKVSGIFYKNELVESVEPVYYPIQILRERRTKGNRKQFLVKFVNYNQTRWVPENYLQSI